jgi:hypothetical protein
MRLRPIEKSPLLIFSFLIIVQMISWRTPMAALFFQQDKETVVGDRLTPTGRVLKPAGELLTFSGRPVDLRLSADQRWLFAKSNKSLIIVDRETFKVVQSIESPDGASLWGLDVGADNRVYFSDSKSGVHVFAPGQGGKGPFGLERSIKLPDDSFPCGVLLSEDELSLYVCLSKKNQVAAVDLKTDKVTKTFETGIAPLDLAIVKGQLFVSNMGGRRAKPGDTTAPSADTPTVVDERGAANNGTVSIFDLATGKELQHTRVKLQPSTFAVSPFDDTVVVCNSNDDSISFVSSQEKLPQTHVVKPDDRLTFGSMPCAITRVKDTRRYAIALAGNNAVTVVEAGVTPKERIKQIALIPTAWYPSAVIHDAQYLYVACVKGLGARNLTRPEHEGRSSYDYMGTIQRIPLSDLEDRAKVQHWNKEVMETAKIKSILEANEKASASPEIKPVPMPEKVGEPSVIKHVFYVIKENRTYDQVFGDIPGSNAMKELCIFPERLSPNHHALAKRFGVLDNYYCNGVLSADGHSWATEGNVTPYLERAFGGFNRSYTFGDDPITYSSSGFVWDHVLAGGFSFRNYGEFDYAEPPGKMEYLDIYKAYEEGKQIEFSQKIGVEKVRRYSCRDYPGWNMAIPDVLRMDRFLKEFREFEKNGELPNFILIYLPQDHFGGGVTTESHMADNDLALGRLVEAVSQSRYWKESVIFVNEDDPQNGFDHVDGHRSICLVISPYSRPGVNSHFYNQTSVLRTILHIFGLPPMNQQDGSMPLMKECFQEVADLTPYKAIPANVPLNTPAPKEEDQSATERKWRGILATVPIQRTGMKTERDEDNLNRFVWHEMRGWETPYPMEWAGAHGKGLKKLKLELDSDADE